LHMMTMKWMSLQVRASLHSLDNTN
jgi:hypothetical protein